MYGFCVSEAALGISVTDLLGSFSLFCRLIWTVFASFRAGIGSLHKGATLSSLITQICWAHAPNNISAGSDTSPHDCVASAGFVQTRAQFLSPDVGTIHFAPHPTCASMHASVVKVGPQTLLFQGWTSLCPKPLLACCESSWKPVCTQQHIQHAVPQLMKVTMFHTQGCQALQHIDGSRGGQDS